MTQHVFPTLCPAMYGLLEHACLSYMLVFRYVFVSVLSHCYILSSWSLPHTDMYTVPKCSKINLKSVKNLPTHFCCIPSGYLCPEMHKYR